MGVVDGCIVGGRIRPTGFSSVSSGCWWLLQVAGVGVYWASVCRCNVAVCIAMPSHAKLCRSCAEVNRSCGTLSYSSYTPLHAECHSASPYFEFLLPHSSTLLPRYTLSPHNNLLRYFLNSAQLHTPYFLLTSYSVLSCRRFGPEELLRTRRLRCLPHAPLRSIAECPHSHSTGSLRCDEVAAHPVP